MVQLVYLLNVSCDLVKWSSFLSNITNKRLEMRVRIVRLVEVTSSSLLCGFVVVLSTVGYDSGRLIVRWNVFVLVYACSWEFYLSFTFWTNGYQLVCCSKHNYIDERQLLGYISLSTRCSACSMLLSCSA